MPVLECAEPDEDAGVGAPQQVCGHSGVVERLAGHFEQQALLGVHRLRFAWCDTEIVGVEPLDVVEEPAPPRGVFHQRRDTGRSAGEASPAAFGHLAHSIGACEQLFPEVIRSVDGAGQAAADAH